MTQRDPQRGVVAEVLRALDTMEHEVSQWEARFLDSLLQQRSPLTPKQYRVLVTMAEAYLAPGWAAELRGQQRLFEETQR